MFYYKFDYYGTINGSKDKVVYAVASRSKGSIVYVLLLNCCTRNKLQHTDTFITVVLSAIG